MFKSPNNLVRPLMRKSDQFRESLAMSYPPVMVRLSIRAILRSPVMVSLRSRTFISRLLVMVKPMFPERFAAGPEYSPPSKMEYRTSRSSTGL